MVSNSDCETPSCLAIFFTNCLTCAKGGNQISKYFDVVPPSLEEYISNVIN